MRILVCLLLCCSCLLPAAEPSAFEQVLELNSILEPELDAVATREAYRQLVATARKAIDGVGEPSARIQGLNSVILSGREVSYLSNLYWRDSSLAAALLRKQGNCMATSTLYALIGHELDLPIGLVLVPGHAFVRYDDGAGTSINIETTNNGRLLSDDHYFGRGKQTTPADRKHLRQGETMSVDDLVTQCMLIAAGELRSRGKLDEAAELYATTRKRWPERLDLELATIMLEADRSGNREAARLAVQHIFRRDPPPGIATDALFFLAGEAASRKDYQRQRQLLMAAFKMAPKFRIGDVCQNLAFCHRSLKDWRGAVLYQELRVVLRDQGDPSLASDLYNLAILQKNNKDLPGALRSIDRALTINPESWNLQVIKAGYLVLSGRREEGEQLFATVQEPRGQRSFWLSMQAWFHAVAGHTDAFLDGLEVALTEASNPHILVWIDQDVDLDPYREHPRFKALLAEHRPRILGEEPVTVP